MSESHEQRIGRLSKELEQLNEEAGRLATNEHAAGTETVPLQEQLAHAELLSKYGAELLSKYGAELLSKYGVLGRWAAYSNEELRVLIPYLRYDLATPWAINTSRWLRRILKRRSRWDASAVDGRACATIHRGERCPVNSL